MHHRLVNHDSWRHSKSGTVSAAPRSLMHGCTIEIDLRHIGGSSYVHGSL